MSFSNPFKTSRDFQNHLRWYVVILAVLWTGLIAGSQILCFKEYERDTRSLAYSSAVTHFNKDKALRLWGTGHGGVYVPTSSHTAPNPYLAHVPERDVQTASGRQLTLMNPAYMIRHLNESYTHLFGISGHITSLKPLRPENAPDAWEKKALLAFEQGQHEYSTMASIESKPYLRFMRPVTVSRGCLKCHGHQGYSVGDIRGGVSVAIPLKALLETETKRKKAFGAAFGVIWLLGMAGLWSGYSRLGNSEKNRHAALLRLSRAHDELELRVKQRTVELQRANADLKWEIDEHLNTQLALMEATEKLETRVKERTRKLSEAVGALQQEIEERQRVEEALRASEKESRHLSRQLLSAEESERKRIARELHDGIGQALSAIKFGVENSLLSLQNNRQANDLQILESIVPLAQETIEEVRRVVKDLRPSILDDLGILATIAWFCREFQNIYHDIRIEEAIDIEEEEIETQLKTVIYRVLQEALNNAARHSGADRVRLELRKNGCRIILKIEDDGTGFDLSRTLSKISSKSGFGLIGIKERIELSGGTFRIRSQPERGTLIRAAWDCTARENC